MWLLVVSGLPLPNYVSGDLEGPAPAVVSGFDRVFLLREIHGDEVLDLLARAVLADCRNGSELGEAAEGPASRRRSLVNT